MIRRLSHIGALSRKCWLGTATEGESVSAIVKSRVNQSEIFRQLESKLTDQKSMLCRVSEESRVPVLTRKPDSVLTKWWWSESPFDQQQQLRLPVYRLSDLVFTNKVVHLEPYLFNQSIRRDIVHRVLHWSLMFNRRTTHRTRTIAEVSGSGKKPRPQKGMGKARQGNLRASGRYHGGKIFGHTPKDFRYSLPEKVKIRGLVSCLSSKLAEGRVRVYESEAMETVGTGVLSKSVSRVGVRETYLFVVPREADRNFILSSGNIPNIRVVSPNEVCVRDLIKFDKLVFTVESLREFSELVLAYSFMLEKPRAVRNESIERLINFTYSKRSPDEETPVYDPQSGWEPRFEILRDYYDQYRSRKSSSLSSSDTKK